MRKKAEATQKAGDLKGLEVVEAEAKAFEEKSVLPKSVPTKGYEANLRTARAKLKDAYAVAVKEHTMAGQRAQAEAVQQELDEFSKGGEELVAGTRRVLIGVWAVTVGSYRSNWTFKNDGTVVQSNSKYEGRVTQDLSGKWAIDAARKHVLITWSNEKQDKFDMPLDPVLTKGAQIGLGKEKLEAVKKK